MVYEIITLYESHYRVFCSILEARAIVPLKLSVRALHTWWLDFQCHSENIAQDVQ